MVDAIVREIELKSARVSDEIQTIYFGGGTPSLLMPAEVSRLLEALKGKFRISLHPEITLEANPEDLTYDKLVDLRSLGINRLSIGIQTFDDLRLKNLNRIHNGKTARDSVLLSKKAGFTNISIDLIFAQPLTDLQAWEKDLTTLIKLNPEHVSIYGLTIEENTVFGRWLVKKKIAPVAEIVNARQYEFAHSALTDAGYQHYEVSNFALPGFRSQHNSSYWRQVPYLGFGPGAHSFDGASRSFNIRNNALYLKSLVWDQIPEEMELLSRTQRLNEYLLTRSRTDYGIHVSEVKKDFDIDLREEKNAELVEMIDLGLMYEKDQVFYTTCEGFKVADEIALKLFFDS